MCSCCIFDIDHESTHKSPSKNVSSELFDIKKF